MKQTPSLLSQEVILHKIYVVRGQNVLLDRDLAELYGVETKQLKRQVNRNPDRFPSDFMFVLTEEELKIWRSQFGTSNSSIKMGVRYSPMAFAEQGVAMLSSVLNSKQAIAVNIQIMRVFTKVRQMLFDNPELRLAIEEIRKKTDNNSKKHRAGLSIFRRAAREKRKASCTNTHWL